MADRKNHALRALNLKDQTVKLVAGTGEQDRSGRDGGGDGLKTGLNSPWDLLYHNNKLFIAMAGHHQIWTYDPATKMVNPYAGNGREDIGDGPLAESSFAQPSGLASDGSTLYVSVGTFNGGSAPQNASLSIFDKEGAGFVADPESAHLLHAVNKRKFLTYAASISNNGRELFFTRAPTSGGAPAIYRATRTGTGRPFGYVQRVAAITGFAEAPSISADGSTLYYHQLVGGQFAIECVTRPPTS